MSAAADSADIDVTGTGDMTQSSSVPSVEGMVKQDADAASVPAVSAASLPATDGIVSAGLSAADSHSDTSADMNAPRSLSAASAEAKVNDAADNDDASAPALSSGLPPTDSHSDTSADVYARCSDAKSVCLLHQLTSASRHSTMHASNKSGAVFWKSSWRQHLCRCSSCLVNSAAYGSVCSHLALCILMSASAVT